MIKNTKFNRVVNRVVISTGSLCAIALTVITIPALVEAQWDSPACRGLDCPQEVYKVVNPPKAKKITPKMPVEMAKQEKDYYNVCNTGNASRLETGNYVVYVCCMPGQECNAEDPKHRE